MPVMKRPYEDDKKQEGVIHLAMEIPTNHLDWFAPFQQFFMALAPEVLRNPKYAAWHLRQSAAFGAPMALDNGSNELGKPLDMNEMMIAATLVGADLIIAPDFPRDSERTVQSCYDFVRETQFDGIVGACQGETIDDMVDCVKEYLAMDITTIGFSWRLPRVELLIKLLEEELLDQRQMYMLLGFKSFPELSKISEMGSWLWLLDTGEPIKAALRMAQMTETYQPLHEAYPLGTEISLTPEQLAIATQNVATMGNLIPRLNELSPMDRSDDDEGDD